ncbi:MAG: HAMP domain-containing histidine kinase [Clostridia bacterium]|nr:HAMP domain-containing histidine kinase [Clostridia bacterium]
MRIKFALVLLVSAVAVILAALILIPVAVKVITGYYLEPRRIDARLDDYIQNFSDYVTEEGIASDDAAAVSRWSTRHKNVHLVVFGSGDSQLGVFDGEILEGDDLPEIQDPILTDNISAGPAMGNTYMVRFSDRICTVSVMDYSGPAVYNGVHIVGILAAVILFFVIVLVYYHIQTKAILHLSSEVEQVSGGALSAPIQSKRNDEIGSLARDVDVMRTTILQKMEEQRAAREANSELITSMSHDIRTPLTTLMGYMELLQNDCEDMTPEQITYIRLCSEKAEQIKELSDKLFLYFWAFSVNEGGVEPEICDAVLLMEQMLGEWILPMETEDIALAPLASELPEGTCMTVDTKCLHRIIDNLFDNIRKYAHRGHPVTVGLSLSSGDREVCITFKNIVSHTAEKGSGTHIGHKTCANMAKLMDGRFETSTKGNTFEARLYLPVAREGL